MSWQIERAEVDSKPCPCGRGRVAVDIEYEDSDWGLKERGWIGSIDCDRCRPLFEFVPFLRGVALADKAQVECSRAQLTKAQELETAFVASADTQAVLERVAAMLEALPTFAAKYRLAVQLGLESATLPTFRKHVRGVPMRRWLDWRFSGESATPEELERLRTLFAHVRADSSGLEAAISQSRSLRDLSSEIGTFALTLGPVSLLAMMGRKAGTRV